MKGSALAWLVVALLRAAPAHAAAVVITDDDFDLAAWDVLEIETGDVTPVPQPDGIGRTEVTRATPGSTGLPGDGFARVLIQGYDTSGSTGYGQIAVLVLRKQAIDPAAAGGFASISYAEQARLIEGAGQGQATGVAVKQGDSLYIRTIATTPEVAWTPKRTAATPVLPGDFSLLQGPGPSTPDLSLTGAPFQIGFFRANSGPAPSPGGTRVAGLDDLLIVLQPPCTSAADCGDDGTACTTETCTAGICSSPLVVCGDGDPCTSDACDPATGSCPYAAEPDGSSCADDDFCDGAETCQGGACVAGPPPDCDDDNPCTNDSCFFECKNYLEPTFAVVDAQIDAFLDRIAGPACSGDPLVKKLRKKLRKAVARARAQVRRADAKTRAAAIAALLGKAGLSLQAARQLLQAAVAAGLLSEACAAELSGLVDELGVCVGALPRHP